MADRKTVLEWALEYHRLSWCVIPIKPGTKKPALRSWKQYQTQRPDKNQLRKWFANIDTELFNAELKAEKSDAAYLQVVRERIYNDSLDLLKDYETEQLDAGDDIEF